MEGPPKPPIGVDSPEVEKNLSPWEMEIDPKQVTPSRMLEHEIDPESSLDQPKVNGEMGGSSAPWGGDKE